MFRADVFFPGEQSVGSFTRFYLGTRPTVTRNFEVDDTVVKEFRDYLAKHNVKYSETDFAENQDWLKRKIKQEVLMSNYGMQEGFKVLLEADPQVQKAVDAVPQARALYENARKIIALRNGSTAHFNQP
jgi:carboxyl-terminal processing protease